MQLYALSAVEAIKKIKNKDISVRQLIDSCIKRIDVIENKVHAWVYFNKGVVYEQLKEIKSRLASGSFDGYFYGVPIGVKDIFNTKDMPACMGSPIWKGFTPGNDARVVHNIRVEGAIVMGKTVTAEFAVHFPGITLNPYNFAYFPGSSSTGSAVAVATAMVPLAIGTQTAGSIIKPASYCGVYGYKPSFGLLPRTGILKTVDPLDHVGFFARCIDDLKLMLDALRVKGINYPYVNDYLENKHRQQKRKLQPWRVAFMKTHVWDSAEEYTKDSILKFVRKLSKVKGIEVECLELPQMFNEAHSIHATIYDRALSYYFKEECQRHPELISNVFKKMSKIGKKITLKEYMDNLEKQNTLALLLDKFFKKYDIILANATAGEPPKKEDYLQEKPDTCLIWTMCRVPSIVAPKFIGPHGIPYGVQFVARRYNDYRLLSFLKFLEKKSILSEAKIVL